ILVNPSINVQIQTYRPFYILGEVKNPGQYPWAHESTVLSAVAVAGGFTYRARQDFVSITRKNGDQVVERRGERSRVTHPRAVVYVSERCFCRTETRPAPRRLVVLEATLMAGSKRRPRNWQWLGRLLWLALPLIIAGGPMAYGQQQISPLNLYNP